jgi:hypothetical protein
MTKTVRAIVNEPIFLISSLKKMAIEAYSILGLGIVVGFIIGYISGSSQ